MFYKVAAGLCIYFIISSLWGVVERKMLPKAKPTGAGAEQAPPGPGGKGGGPGVTRPKPGPKSPKRPGPKTNGTDGMLGKVKEMWTELLEQAKKK